MRSFLAIELPSPLRRDLGERVNRVRPELPPARWVPCSNYHLTLVFLGDLPASRGTALTARLGDVFRGAAAFDLRLEGGGCFPPGRPARVAWVGVPPEAPLLELRREAFLVCRSVVGLEAERRPYRPHLTVARCRPPWPASAGNRWRDGLAGPVGKPFLVREGVLMESRLGPTGATYHPRARLPLGKGQ